MMTDLIIELIEIHIGLSMTEPVILRADGSIFCSCDINQINAKFRLQVFRKDQ